MIDSLNGELLLKATDHVVVECHGVGYLVHVSAMTLTRMPDRGACRVFVHYGVTVDVRSGQSEHRLHGFLRPDERAMFRRLIEVQGVSATLAMAIMGARDLAGLEEAIALGDEASFKGVKGIGPKLAQRIISELQGKAPLSTGLPSAAVAGAGNTLRAEALSALVSLGLDRAKAERSLQAVLRDHASEPPALEELIKLTLKHI
ncbi:MAG: Holliday junction branch migration protein RuvA [Flavobacteriales bacterium]|nr:Holliday junction branch migration protein RuvA [Flavobacteriales bacterium]